LSVTDMVGKTRRPSGEAGPIAYRTVSADPDSGSRS
jgi:hypothetical protein